MEIDLPKLGCSIYYGNYVDNYYNSVRTRYYLNENKLVKSTTSNYTRLPDGAVCLSSGDLFYKPETEVYFNVISLFIAIVIFGVAIRLFFYPFWRRIRS